MAQRSKRSISLPPELAQEIDKASEASGASFSAWIADTAARRLKLEDGRRGIEEWEKKDGPLTEAERAEAQARVDSLLGKRTTKKPSRRSA